MGLLKIRCQCTMTTILYVDQSFLKHSNTCNINKYIGALPTVVLVTFTPLALKLGKLQIDTPG